MIIDAKKIVEVKSLPLSTNDLSDPRHVLSDALRGMAYSLRGNNDQSYRLMLLLYRNDLNRLSNAEYSRILQLIQDMARPYWNEFSWKDENGREHDGYERFQIWIEEGTVKCTPTLLLDRFWRWGEDGTLGKAFGELEYKAILNIASAGPRNRFVQANEPIRSTYKGVAFWEGLPHLAKAKALDVQELYAVPGFFVRPFFSGFITPDRTQPFLSWHDALRRESATAESVFQSNIAQYLPQSSHGDVPQVQWHVATSRETYMAPGGGIYAFTVAAKSNPNHYFAYQPTTQDSRLTNNHLAEARLYDAVQKSGKCLIWRTIDSDIAISPKLGLPFGPYYSVAWIYSGLIRRQIQRLIESGTLLRAGTLAEQQTIINKTLDEELPFQTDNPIDELEAVHPKRFAELWYSVRASGLKGWLRRRQSSHVSEEVYDIYKDTFLQVLASINEPPIPVRKVPVITLAGERTIVNLLKNVERDYGSR